MVPPEKAPQLNPENYAGYAQYVKAQYELWVGTALTDEQFAGNEWRFALASWLKEHFFFHNLLKALGGKILEYGEILQKLERVTPGFSQDDCAYGQHLLESLLSLISEARLPRKETPEEKTLRELEGMPPPADPFLYGGPLLH